MKVFLDIADPTGQIVDAAAEVTSTFLPYIIAAIAALLVIAAVIITIVVLKKKKKAGSIEKAADVMDFDAVPCCGAVPEEEDAPAEAAEAEPETQEEEN